MPPGGGSRILSRGTPQPTSPRTVAPVEGRLKGKAHATENDASIFLLNGGGTKVLLPHRGYPRRRLQDFERGDPPRTAAPGEGWLKGKAHASVLSSLFLCQAIFPERRRLAFGGVTPRIGSHTLQSNPSTLVEA